MGSPEEQASDLSALAGALRAFAQERDWEQFHSPKNLAAALTVEAAELLELFQWSSPDRVLDHETLSKAAGEAADVLIYLVRFVDVAGIDLYDAVQRKLAENRLRYPAESVRGSAKKRERPKA